MKEVAEKCTIGLGLRQGLRFLDAVSDVHKDNVREPMQRLSPAVEGSVFRERRFLKHCNAQVLGG